MAPKQADTKKQSRLDFTAAKRTASTAAAGKPKATTQSRSNPTASPATASPVVEPSTKEPKVDAVEKDEIEAAEDLAGNDSDSVSSVSTWETLDDHEQKPDTGLSKAPVAAASAAGTTSKTEPSSTPRQTRSATQKDNSKAPPKVSEETTTEQQATKSLFKSSNATAEQVAQVVEANSRKVDQVTPPELDVKAAKYRRYHDALKKEMGGLPAIHDENENKVHQILRVFDNAYEYGPCVGVSRRERWDRAQALGLKPPKEVDEILNTKQGRTLPEYSQSVFFGQV